MNFKTPKTFMGYNGKENYYRIINSKEAPKETPKKKNVTEPISFKRNFTKSDYIQIPNQNFVIAIGETNKNLNYENAHIKTIKQDLRIPTSNQFMTFHNYFHNAYKNNIQIFDAIGNPISENTKEDLYNQLIKSSWTWLNGKFNISNTKTIEYITGLDSNDNLLTRKEPLENCLMADCYIDFTKLTKQGLGLIKHSNRNFKSGENIYFFKPINGKVTRFFAGHSGACLSCDRDRSVYNSDLGVRRIKMRKIE